MKGLFISEVTQLWYAFFSSHFCLPFRAFELKMLIRRTRLFIEWGLPPSLSPPPPTPHISGLSFVLLMVEERAVCGIKGSHKNVLNTSKSLQSVSYLCLLPLSPMCVFWAVGKPAA